MRTAERQREHKERGKVLRRWQKGMSLVQIARDLGRPVRCIALLMPELIPLAPPPKPVPPRNINPVLVDYEPEPPCPERRPRGRRATPPSAPPLTADERFARALRGLRYDMAHGEARAR